MFGISMWEVGLIMLLALLVLGPRQLVDAARVVGKLYREVQKMAWDVRNAVDLEAPLPTSNEKPTTDTPEENKAAGRDPELMPPPGENSGPDFYAELLESSKESDEESAKGSQGSDSTEKTGGDTTGETETQSVENEDKKVKDSSSEGPK